MIISLNPLGVCLHTGGSGGLRVSWFLTMHHLSSFITAEVEVGWNMAFWVMRWFSLFMLVVLTCWSAGGVCLL